MSYSFTSFHLVYPFLLYLSFTSSAFSDQLSSSFASTEIKFWSENVKSEMPAAISAKLSPLTKQDSMYYSEIISQDKFTADTKFCLLAKLACLVDQRPSYSHIDYGAKTISTIPLEKIDPFSFFRLSNLKEGYTIHLSTLKESLPRAFLPPQITSKISFSPTGIAKIFTESSKEAINITFSYCNAAAIKGETKSCPKSLEEMISFSKTVLGKSKLLALSSESTARSGKELTIKKVKQFSVEKVVACHQLFLPFATYYCHSLSSSQLYSVEFVEPKTGAPVSTALAVCHMDTSSWSENHVAFKLLKFGPGQGEACHWLNEVDLAWIASGENI